MSTRNVVLFISHKFGERIMGSYCDICRHLPDEQYDVVWVVASDSFDRSELPENVNARYYVSEDLATLGYTPIENTLIPGSPHFIPLRFFLDNPHYRHYWFIEYDVEDLAMITNVYIRQKNILQDINGRSTTPLGAD